MDNFKKKFVEEALDLLNELEVVLLRLESDSENKEVIEHIFRIMHTLKGNSAMFGFNLIDQYTHQLETIYDFIRNGKMKITSALMDLTLASVDHIRNLLDEDVSTKSEVMATHASLLQKIGLVIEEKNQPVSHIETPTSVITGDIKTYYIHFQPDPGILGNGTNPLFLVEDFKTLGEYLTFPRMEHLPSFDDLDPEKCFTSWEILLATTEEIEKILEIFIFAEDCCTIDVQEISSVNLLTDPLFCNKIKESASDIYPIGIQKVKDIIASGDEIEKKTDSVQPRDIGDVSNKLKNISSIRVSSEKLDELINLVSELVTTQAGLSLIAENINNKELLALAEDIEKLSRRLRDNTFGIRLIPIENMITRFQRLVRELSHELNKDITFTAEGTDIELDKTMIEGLIDPIMHIIRNSIDHGIEDAGTRKKLGKLEKGKIIFRAYYSGSNVYIKISDDGAGIDVNKIRQHAIKKGLIQQDAAIGGKEILDLIFLPGFTTAENITKISGRGVGMDVVKRKISDLRGEVNIETQINSGTTITIKLPLTLSIIDGLLVEIDKAFFVIPLSSVSKCFEFKHETLINAVNNLIFVNDGHIPFIYLRKEFEISSPSPMLEQVVVIEYGETRIGLTVDKVIGEYQAVLKALGSAFKKQDIISGATILGDGTVALVVDPNKIINQFTYQNLATLSA
jgi:two-component system, chemotaxis family, sensor kinase CheA